MNKLVLLLLVVSLLGALGSTASSYCDSEVPEAAGTVCNGTESKYLASSQDSCTDTANNSTLVEAETVNITSNSRIYPAYTAAPAEEGNYPAIVLIHSFRGFEPGYQTMVNRMAEEGYVVIAPFWQAYSDSPSDTEVEALIRNSTAYLETRDDVNSERLGLTGFCAGGRYTMLFLPQIEEFESGVAWYGFPYMGGSEIQPDIPASLIDQLDAPMLIIHGTRDQYSNITDIYRYAGELDAADRYFELKVYQGEPHGFMLTEEGELSESFVAQDAYGEMITFFDRTLNNSTM
ncbi:dienelactone hydrolase family protein [Methanosarcina sp. MSH10X1]|uniref:dienelactone hydrolase family protein n=1 Tax=Methanosarcina sp. MSH10X1 TaxID=2507075 RepID=UPI001F0C49EC|nr:dienelactone hydrolase family protein [Methanosarcina sp. MSH10X1]